MDAVPQVPGLPPPDPENEAFVSLYRRFRPGRFSELRGQPHVVRALQGAVRDSHVAHAYLFSGPRGTGKTSTARILARALNCAAPVDGEPCGVCSSCIDIARGHSLDVHELDAASNNGVDAMRDLVSHAALGTPGRWKIYIVDEVHMLSTQAANALLKTLEEPPSHVVFVLATTDPQKVPATIRSRTQHLEFRLLGAGTLEDLLREVRDRAGLDLSDDALSVAVRRGRGSARDALSALDQVAASGSADDARPELSEVVEALCDDAAGRVMVAVAGLVEDGWGPQQVATELVDDLRQAFLSALAPGLSSVTGTDRDRLVDQAERLGLPRLVRAMEALGRAQVDMRDAPDPRVVLEITLVRLARPELDDSPAALADRISRLERAIGSGAIHLATGHPSAPPAPPLPAAAEHPADPQSRPALGAIRRQRRATEPGPADAPAVPAPPPPRSPAPSADEAVLVEGPGAPPAAAPTAAPAAAPTAAPVAAPTAAPTAAPAGALPDRDTLQLEWGDHILRDLPRGAKARYSAGRFVAVEDGVALFALPNAAHRDFCAEVKGEVEAALRDYFHVAVPLRLVVDDDPSRTGGGPSRNPRAETPNGAGAARDPEPAPPDPDEEDFDPDEAAEPVAMESVAEARLLEAFPGAQEVAD